MEVASRRTRDLGSADGTQDTRDTLRISRSRSRPSVPPATTGGAYSITTPPRSRGTVAPVAPPPPSVQAHASKVTALPSGSIRIELAGREVVLGRRDARTLLERLQRALK